MMGRIRKHGRLTAFATGAAACVGLACIPAAAQAGVSIGAVPAVPPAVTVGQTVPGSLVISNASFNGQGESDYDTDSLEVTEIGLVPSCGSQVISAACPDGFEDAGVLVPAPGGGTGRAGTACAGTIFEIAQIGVPADGEYSFTPDSTVTLGASSGPPGGKSCTIDYSLTVNRVPAIDAHESPGLQTDQKAFVSAVNVGVNFGLTAAAVGTAMTTVSRATPAITTQVVPAAIELGQTFNDTATLTGGVQATGTVTFDVYGPDDPECALPPAGTSTNPLEGGTTATSNTFTPAAAGTYRVRATYNGDSNNAPVTGACDDPAEVVVVSPPPPPPPPPLPPPPPPPLLPATPRMTTVASPSVALGGQITDTATITGRVNPVAGATVQFRLYAPGDIACTGTPVLVSTVPVSAAGTATSAPFTTTEAGTYRWRAFYSGDANNVAVSGACNDPGESVTVTSATQPQIISARFASQPVVGRSTSVTVRASATTGQISGVQVGFGEPRGQYAISACRVAALGALPGSRVIQLPYTFRRPGPHVVRIVTLAGGCAGALRRAETTIGVNVAPATTARRVVRRAAARRSSAVRAAAAAAGCRDRFLTPTKANIPRVAAATLCLVNVERRRRGRKKLLPAPRLRHAATAHSADMVRRKYFRHERVPGGPKLVTRLRKAGYRGRTYAENIGSGSTNPPALQVRAWMNSPGHRANILHPRLRYAGVGLAIGYHAPPQLPGATYTMNFGGTLR